MESENAYSCDVRALAAFHLLCTWETAVALCVICPGLAALLAVMDCVAVSWQAHDWNGVP